MANDFKIKFEYKGIGKSAAATRQKVLQSQKSAAQKPTGDTTANREFIGSIKLLNTSINKLIASNKSLENAIKKQKSIPQGPGGGGGDSGGGGDKSGGGGDKSGGGGDKSGGGGDKSGGFGGMGASLPILGAALSAIGFTIQKVNQIGSAYMERTGQQFGNVGVAGFRGAHGLYNSAEVGGGMKSYSAGTGRFERSTAVNQSAVDISTMYGLSLDETMKQAGVFSRTGGDYSGVANRALGSGIESELPILLSGLSDTLESAVKEGINTSDMSKDIGKELINLAMKTPGKSVQAALGSIDSFKGIKQSLGSGKMGTSVENMYAAQATKTIMMQNLTGENKKNYIETLSSNGLISDQQKEKLLKLKNDAGYEDVQRTLGGTAAHFLFKNTAETTASDKLKMQTMREIQKGWGTGIEDFQRFDTFAGQIGFSDRQSMSYATWMAAQGKSVPGAEIGGEKIRQEGVKSVVGSDAGLSRERDIRREALMFEYGASFAEASLKMERKMLEIAKVAAPKVVKGMELVDNAATSLGTALGSLSKKINNSKGKDGSFSIWNFFTGN